ncbi:15003_t:CDS:1, partial [Entrophospora sp. SA101]
SLESMIKILEGKLKSAQMDVLSVQNDSLKKDSEILSLRSKIAELENIKSELESKVNELECLKSEVISIPVVGGNDEKNTLYEEQSSMTKSDDISAVIEPIKNLSQYFIRKKNMDQAGKIDGNISDHTRPLSASKRHDEITEPLKVDTEISSKINEETIISEISKDILPVQEIKNVNPHLAQRENYTPSLMSQLSAYIFLIILIIAVMWFVVLRRTWGLKRKSEQLQDVWARY